MYRGDGLNLYAYCDNNPVVYWDPSGYAKKPCDGKDVFGKQKAKLDEITKMSHGTRPNPETYLSEEYIANHLKKFEEGAAKIVPFNPTGPLGPEAGTFVMPKSVVDDVIKKSGGDPRKIEEALGLDKGYLGTTPNRVDIPSPKNARIPSGNEPGANAQWEAGGYTSGGIPEAVIDRIPETGYIVTPIKL